MLIPQEVKGKKSKIYPMQFKGRTNKGKSINLWNWKEIKQYRKLMKNIIKIDDLLARLR